MLAFIFEKIIWLDRLKVCASAFISRMPGQRAERFGPNAGQEAERFGPNAGQEAERFGPNAGQEAGRFGPNTELKTKLSMASMLLTTGVCVSGQYNTDTKK